MNKTLGNRGYRAVRGLLQCQQALFVEQLYDLHKLSHTQGLLLSELQASRIHFQRDEAAPLLSEGGLSAGEKLLQQISTIQSAPHQPSSLNPQDQAAPFLSEGSLSAGEELLHQNSTTQTVPHQPSALNPQDQAAPFLSEGSLSAGEELLHQNSTTQTVPHQPSSRNPQSRAAPFLSEGGLSAALALNHGSGCPLLSRGALSAGGGSFNRIATPNVAHQPSPSTTAPCLQSITPQPRPPPVRSQSPHLGWFVKHFDSNDTASQSPSGIEFIPNNRFTSYVNSPPTDAEFVVTINSGSASPDSDSPILVVTIDSGNVSPNSDSPISKDDQAAQRQRKKRQRLEGSLPGSPGFGPGVELTPTQSRQLEAPFQQLFWQGTITKPLRHSPKGS
eukprot:gene27348-4647_t